LADFNYIWHAALQKTDVNECSFGHLILILLLHYVVKCRSCSLAVYSTFFETV